MFFAPEIFLDRHYKIRPSTDHRAKFHADQPTHLGDLAVGKKTSGLKLKSAPQAIASGRTNKSHETNKLHNFVLFSRPPVTLQASKEISKSLIRPSLDQLCHRVSERA